MLRFSAMRVALAIDENFAMPLGVTLRSIAEHTSEPVEAFVLDGGVTQWSKRKIAASLAGLPIQVRWIARSRIEAAIEQRKLPTRGGYTRATYYRFLLPSLLPASVDKVLYLDADILALTDLVPLWQTDVSTVAFAAAGDSSVKTVGDCRHLPPCQLFAEAQDSTYFNAGILVVNLAYWREHDVAGRAFDVIDVEREKLLFLDQDALNLSQAHRWKKISPSWNSQHLVFTYATWQEGPYAEEDFLEARERPKIVHFTTHPKPWASGGTHPYQDSWLQVVDRTKWAGWRNSFAQRVLRRARRTIIP